MFVTSSLFNVLFRPFLHSCCCVQVKLDHDDDDGDSEFEISDEEDDEEEVRRNTFSCPLFRFRDLVLF
jgi:hypothetical protein